MSQRRRKLVEGDPIAPIPTIVSSGLHERDVYIGAALSAAHSAWDHNREGNYWMTPAQVADRAISIADAVMTRKEGA